MERSTTVAAPWRVLGGSVRGASHEHGGTPNQDAIGWSDGDGVTKPLVLAVSDGHGSGRCFRSDDGSRLAVATVLDVLGKLRAMPAAPAEIEALKRTLVEGWRKRVLRHIEEHPFDPTERRELGEGYGEDDALLAYGATMLAVAVTSERVLFAQLGDGDILTSDDAGTTTRVFEKDPTLAINETHSLCQPDAARWMRVRTVTTEVAPPLVLVSTDGYGNSFRSDADFFLVGRDFRELIRTRGIDAIAEQLPAILAEAQRLGSRDDCTLGIVERVEDPETPAADARRTSSAPAGRPGGEPVAATQRLEPVRSPERAGSGNTLALVAAALIGAVLVALVLLVGWPLGRASIDRSADADAATRLQAGDYAGALAASDGVLARDPYDIAARRTRAEAALRLLAAGTARTGGAANLSWPDAVEAWAAVVALDEPAGGHVTGAVEAADLAGLALAFLGSNYPNDAVNTARAAAVLDARWRPFSAALAKPEPHAYEVSKFLPKYDATIGTTARSSP